MNSKRWALSELIKQDLLLSAPTLAVAIALVAVLSLKNKQSAVEIVDAHAGFLSFEVLASGETDPSVSLMDAAVSVTSITVTNAGPISLNSASLTAPSGEVWRTAPAARPLTVVAGERTRAARVTWRTTGADLLHVTGLTVWPGASVSLDAVDGVLTLRVRSDRVDDRPPSLTLSLPGTTQLTLERSAVVDQDGRVLLDVREGGQVGLDLRLAPVGRTISVSGASGTLALQLMLPDSVPVTEVISRVKARRIHFLRTFHSGPELEGEHTLRSARLRLKDIPSHQELTVEREEFFADPDSFFIDHVSVNAEDLKMGASSLAALRSLRIGRTRHSAREQLMSVLEWLFQDNLIAISTMLMLWFLGKAFAIRRSYAKRLAQQDNKGGPVS